MIEWLTRFRFQDPLWLLALLPCIAALWWRGRRRPAVTFSSVASLRGLPVSLAQRLRRWLPWLRLLGLTLLVTALARPQQGQEEFRIRTEGIDILMCIDRSGSMQAMDFQKDGGPVNRLTVVKDVFRDFVLGAGELGGRPDDRIGLVAFGGFARSLCPLTLDHGMLAEILDQVEIPQPVTDDQGRIVDREFAQAELDTAIGDALARSIDLLKDGAGRSRVIVLLSDGENTAGVVPPLDAADAAAALGLKVYTIGIGSTGTAPFPVTDRFGQIQFQRGEVRLDETLLREIAKRTGGEYFNARDTDSLARVYQRIDELEKTETETLQYTRYRELYLHSLLPGVALLLLELLLSATRLSSLP